MELFECQVSVRSLDVKRQLAHEYKSQKKHLERLCKFERLWWLRFYLKRLYKITKGFV